MTVVKFLDARGSELVPDVVRVRHLSWTGTKGRNQVEIIHKADEDEVWLPGFPEDMLRSGELPNDCVMYAHQIMTNNRNPLSVADYVEYVLLERNVQGERIYECHANSCGFTFIMNDDGKTIDKI